MILVLFIESKQVYALSHSLGLMKRIKENMDIDKERIEVEIHYSLLLSIKQTITRKLKSMKFKYSGQNQHLELWWNLSNDCLL